MEKGMLWLSATSFELDLAVVQSSTVNIFFS